MIHTNLFFKGLRVLLVMLVASLSGCAVAPWERGNLAKPHMALDANALHKSLKAHNYSSREAAYADTSGGGGGCGCY